MTQTPTTTPVPQSCIPPVLHLDDDQAAAARTGGRVVINSGPGAGKTRLLAGRYVHVHNAGMDASRLLALTFNTTAAAELLARVDTYLPPDVARPLITTTHSFGLSIIRDFQWACGLNSKRRLDIADERRAFGVLRQAAASIKTQAGDLADVFRRITLWKANLVTPEKALPSHPGDTGPALYRAYMAALETNNMIDFADMLYRPALALTNQQTLAVKIGRRFIGVIVDEGQDMNDAQTAIVMAIAASSGNLMVVADLDQTINRWAGANLSLVQKVSAHPRSKYITFGGNYRSTPEIVAFASAIIEKQEDRLPKKLVAKRPSGVQPREHAHRDADAEAKAIAKAIQGAIARGVEPKEIAVLARVTRVGPAIADELTSRGIPCEIWGSRFYELAEVKAVLALAAVAEQPENSETLAAAAAAVGLQGTAACIRKAMPENASDFLVAAATNSEVGAEPERALALATAAAEAYALIQASGDRIKGLQRLIDATGLKTQLPSDHPKVVEYQGNIEAAVRAYARHASYQAWADHAAQANKARGTTNAVVIATMHSSKGHEWDIVHLAAWENGIVPHRQALEDLSIDGLTEERNLAYVGATRAKNELHIHWAQARDGSSMNTRSPYLDDADGAFVPAPETANRTLVTPMAPTDMEVASVATIGAVLRTVTRLEREDRTKGRLTAAEDTYRRTDDGRILIAEAAIAQAAALPIRDVRAALGRLVDTKSSQLRVERTGGLYFAGMAA